MKTGYIQEVVAATALVGAIFNGANAYHHHEEANSAAEGITHDSPQQDAEWAARRDNENLDGVMYLGLAVTSLGAAATFGALGASSIRRRREAEKAGLPTPPASKTEAL